MNREFIPHEQSLELRKLEFSEPCLGFYVGKDKEVFMSSHDFNAPYQFRLDSKTTFVAPTFTQCFRWFRKKYKLGHSICPYSLNAHIIELEPIDDEPKEYTVYGLNLSNYDDAELECLNKLIEIVKNK